MDEVSLTARLSSALIRDNNDVRCDKIAYSVSSSSRNSRTFVRRSTRFPEWINDSLEKCIDVDEANATRVSARRSWTNINGGVAYVLQ